MATQAEQQQHIGIGNYNQSAINNQNFMMMRLDTSPLIKSIRKGLGAKDNYLVQDKKGDWFETETSIGEAMANEEGIAQICNMIEELINQHTAQGNLDDDHYWEFLKRTRKEIAITVVLNCYQWEIKDANLGQVIDRIARLVELFLTRPIDNKERDSFGQNYLSKEIVTNNPRINPVQAMGSFNK